MPKRSLLLCSLLALFAVSARAATVELAGAGPRVGFSVDPDQFVFGGQAIIGEVAPDITFDPNLELGFGDHLTVIAFNLDLHYHFTIERSQWRPYVGAGVGINFVELDLPPPARDRSQTDVGGNFILGAGVPTSSGNRFFSELKFGLGDIPTLKMLVGWNFKI